MKTYEAFKESFSNHNSMKFIAYDNKISINVLVRIIVVGSLMNVILYAQLQKLKFGNWKVDDISDQG